MKPILVTHETYQNFVIEQLQKHYSGSILTLVSRDLPTITKLWITDLSYVTTWLSDTYSLKGPTPRDPASMLRSYLLFLLTNPTIGITKWIDEMHRVPLYAILSGFEPGDIPGVGTFYDFFRRLWGQEKDNIKPKIQRKRKKLKKGEKQVPKDPGIVEKLVNRFRHDAVSFVASSIEFLQRFALGTIGRMLLDAAHDAEAIYELLHCQDVEPFIDLNSRSKKIIVQGVIFRFLLKVSLSVPLVMK